MKKFSSLSSFYKRILSDNEEHKRQLKIIKYLHDIATKSGVSEHVYIVGGAVRDFYLNKPIKDVDVVIDSINSGMTSREFAEIIAKDMGIDLGESNRFGVELVNLGRDNKLGIGSETIEIANARKESYSLRGNNSHKPSEVKPATIEEDVNRREFTFNTLMWRLSDVGGGPKKSITIDITGRGIKDLETGVIRSPVDPKKTFQDDPTRIIRAIKFMGRYNFTLPEDTKKAIIECLPRMEDESLYPAIGKLIIEDILSKPFARRAVDMMVDVGISEVAEKIYQRNRQFKSSMDNFLKRIMIDDFELTESIVDSFNFDDPYRNPQYGSNQKIRSIMRGLSQKERGEFWESIRSPKLDYKRIMSEYSISGEEIRKLALEIIKDDFRLSLNRDKLTEIVIKKISGQ